MALHPGASIAKVKKFNMNPGATGYQDIKVNIRFANGGIGEVILVSDYMFDAKMNRGGHKIYEIQRTLSRYKDVASQYVAEVLNYFNELEDGLYSRGPGAPDSASFASMNSKAFDSLTRLLSQMSSPEISFDDITTLKSLSLESHLAKPPSTSSYAMPSLSLMKNMDTSVSVESDTPFSTKVKTADSVLSDKGNLQEIRHSIRGRESLDLIRDLPETMDEAYTVMTIGPPPGIRRG